MSQLTLRKATRQQTKIRIGLSGPSGSGKTYSALLLASGMAPWEKIAVIDTENGSADLYSHLGPYSVITLTAPFSPERYIEAIEACEKAGMEVVVIDSVTHEWEGKGGCLESNELLGQTKFKGNVWSAWSVTTPRHQRFLAAIINSRCHVITTARSKTDTIQTEDKKIKKVGMKEIQREGFEFELTLNFTLDREGHYATASKDRTEMFIDIDPFKITRETGEKILAWTKMGVAPLKPKITVQQAMERMNMQKDKAHFHAAYEEAFQQEWSEEDAKTLGECYVNGVCRFAGWIANGTRTQLFENGQVVAGIARDGRGKLSIHKIKQPEPAAQAEQPKADQEEKAVADAERAGMQAA